FSSRKIERATHFDLACRFIAGGHHPDHDTIASFRQRHIEELKAMFVTVLLLAREMGFAKMGTVAVDGTKIKASASRHAAVSYKRSRQIERRLREEVARLVKMAGLADNEPMTSLRSLTKLFTSVGLSGSPNTRTASLHHDHHLRRRSSRRFLRSYHRPRCRVRPQP
ncbi:MAG: transposase, partial [Candidatus Sumerlaeota bacterium]